MCFTEVINRCIFLYAFSAVVLDGLSAYLIAMMRYLAHWQFDRKFADKQYEGFELNVFENVCEHFVKGCPLLPTLLAVAILNIVSVVRARNTSLPLVISPMSEFYCLICAAGSARKTG